MNLSSSRILRYFETRLFDRYIHSLKNFSLSKSWSVVFYAHICIVVLIWLLIYRAGTLGGYRIRRRVGGRWLYGKNTSLAWLYLTCCLIPTTSSPCQRHGGMRPEARPTMTSSTVHLSSPKRHPPVFPVIFRYIFSLVFPPVFPIICLSLRHRITSAQRKELFWSYLLHLTSLVEMHIGKQYFKSWTNIADSRIAISLTLNIG